MRSSEVRQKFYDFFIARDHEQVASSPLIPAQDPTLLFTNAGMNQFKDVFLGLEKRSYTRAVSIQKCMRAGGKHNDLDNVGFTKRHLTLFEMMGNFSFGDYFKKEAIRYAWEFLTKHLGISAEQLHASVYETDDESYDLWRTMIGLPASRVHRLGASENFWQMGDLGPCGPSTELHLDRGPAHGCKDDKKCGPACECDRYLELWNLVFMQYDQQEDGSMKDLAQKGVDTGAGLERICAVLQDKESVFGTDIFSYIIRAIEEQTGKSYEAQSPQLQAAFHVMADHIRASTFLIADGCAPSNEGRGYVLRKIIRRAALFAQKLSDKDFFPELAHAVIREMGDYYPELPKNEKLIVSVLRSETKKFATNLIRGRSLMERIFAQNGDKKVITGEQAFKLYDTYGFPIELVVIIAHEHGSTVDEPGFEKHMKRQREKSGKKMTDPLDHVEFDPAIQTTFTGYDELKTDSEIIALVVDTQSVTSVSANQECWVIARKAPFFIVGGGQVPDQGWLVLQQHRVVIKQVRYLSGRIAMCIVAPCDLRVGDAVTSEVDEVWRTRAMKNHTATHILQSVLIELFGKHIKQSGSLVHPDYLRFDFTYHEQLTDEQIRAVEDLVNKKIMENIPVEIEYTSMREAVKRGALAFFGDKYNPDDVRMVKVADFSVELCGGTHVSATGVIGAFKIVEVSTPSAGHRRIVAVTGPGAIELFQESFSQVRDVAQMFKVPRSEVHEVIAKQAEQVKQLQDSVKRCKRALWQEQLPGLLEKVQNGGLPHLYVHLPDFAHDELREVAQALAARKPGLYFVTGGQQADDDIRFVVSLASEHVQHVPLKELSQWLAQEYGLRGGGSKTILQGGGAALPSDFSGQLTAWVRDHTKTSQG